VFVEPRPDTNQLFPGGAPPVEALATNEVLDVALGSGEEIIEADEIGAALHQAFAQVRAEEAGPAGHQNAFFQVHGIPALRNRACALQRDGHDYYTEAAGLRRARLECSDSLISS
jgi:hypothetical protein